MAEGFGLTIQECMALCDEQGDGTLIKQFGRVEDVAKLLRVTDVKKGIDSDDIELRRQIFGANTVPEPPKRTYLGMVLDSLKDTTMIVLIIAAIVSLVIAFVKVNVDSPCSDFEPHKVIVDEESSGGADYIEAIAIIVAVIVISNVTAMNEYSKEKQFRALNEASRNSLVIQVSRAGRRVDVQVKDLVVGDVIHLTPGQKVPADGLCIDGQNLTCNESALTGEPDSKKKFPGTYMKSGALVDQGDGRMIALAVGEHTDAGRAVSILSGEGDETPLQLKLDVMAAQIGKGGLAFAIFTFISAVIRFAVCRADAPEKFESGELKVLLDYLILAITIIVVAVPEGLPLAVTISLAYSMMKMMQDQNLVRKLAACETMGGATNICSDKTGTLTENRMAVTEGLLLGVHVKTIPDKENVETVLNLKGEKAKWLSVLQEGLAANTQDASFVQLSKSFIWEFKGNKTECALLVLCVELGGNFEHVREEAWSRHLRTINFSSDRKRMSTVFSGEGNTWRVHTKGAGEIVTGLCTKMVGESGKVEPISSAKRQEIEAILKTFTESGLRTLCLGVRDMPAALMIDVVPEEDIEQDLTMLAIVGIKDPVREAVPLAVKMCRSAGITVRMVTGDNIDTAKHIARECGILDEGGLAMTGSEFRDMPREEIVPLLPRLQVLARSKPTDKFLLVQLLKEQGEVVAVTGDGTNDAPALKEADVGLAMGIAGTDVAQKASDIIILDDNFASIVRAVLWGRNVYDSIRKFLQFQLTVNVSALVIAYIGAVVDSRSPVTPVQLLWINLIMDTLAALALATEPPHPSQLQRKPHGRFDSLINYRMAVNIVGQASLQIFILLFMLFKGEEYFVSDKYEPAHRREVNYTLIFNSFVFLQVFNEINSRELGTKLNVFRGLFVNKLFLGVIIGTTMVQALLIEVGSKAIQTVSLNAGEFFGSFAVGLISIPWGVLLKFIPVPEPKVTSPHPPALGEQNLAMETKPVQRAHSLETSSLANTSVEMQERQ